MKSKPYKAKTISGAEARVRNLQKQIKERDRWLGLLRRERDLALRELEATREDCVMLAKLSLERAFFSPTQVWAAQAVRNRVLENAGLKPDGTRA